MHRKSVLLVMTLFFLWTCPAWAQRVTDEPAGTTDQADVTSAAQEAPDVEPVRRSSNILLDLVGDLAALPSRRTLLGLTGGGVLAAGGHLLDDELSSVPGEEWSRGTEFFDVGALLGNGAIIVGSAALTYGIGHMSDRPAATRVGAELLRAQGLANLMVHGIKPLVGRTRPDASSDNSFPSGHAAGAFAAAVVLQHSLARKWTPLTYGVATYVAMSRMHENRHYLSDVIFGSAIGLVSGWTVTREAPRRLAMTPIVTRSNARFLITYAFP